MVCSVASRWMAPTTISRASASPSACACPLDLANHHRGVPLGLVLDSRDELGTRLLGGQPGGLLQHVPAVVFQPVQRDLPGGQGYLGGGQVAGPFVELGLTGVQPVLPLGRPVLATLQLGEHRTVVAGPPQRDRVLDDEDHHDGENQAQDHEDRDVHSASSVRRRPP